MVLPMEHACDMLKNNLEQMGTVNEWAGLMGRSRNEFTYQFKKCYGITPAQKMAAIRKEKLEEMLIRDPSFPAALLARELGLKRAKSLCGYVSRRYHTTLTAMRRNAIERKWNRDTK